jgi:RHS repeat-associated protein
MKIWIGLVSKGRGGQNSRTYQYIYDYRTRRVGRTEPGGGGTTQVVFSGGTSVRERMGNGETIDYVRGNDMGGGVGGILYSLRNGLPSYAHYNRRGDVTTRTVDTGLLTYQASYQGDGRRTVEVGDTQDRQAANTKEEDPTGLLNEGFRYRDLETLTFMTRDPAGFVDGPNLYAYVRQNPWTAFDPDGLAALNHTTDSADAERMIKECFKPNQNGLRWMTSPDIAGEEARKSGVNMNYDVQIEKMNIQEITGDQMSAWKKQARTEILAGGVKNSSPKFGSRYGARLNEMRANWMAAQKGADGFVISGEKGPGKLYALTEQGWQKGGSSGISVGKVQGFAGVEVEHLSFANAQ